MMIKKNSKKNDPFLPRPSTFEDFRILTHHIMQLAMQGLLRNNFLKETSKILAAFSGCDSVEIWLIERGRCYCCEVNRLNTHQLHFEIRPTIKGKNNQVFPKIREDQLPDRLYKDIFLRRLDPALQFYTKSGSFWSGDIKSAFTQISQKMGIKNSDQFTLIKEFKSIVIIPISVQNERIGLLQLKSESPDYFLSKDIEFYESVVQTLVMALVHRRAQIELRERIKELTCLYGIAKLVENTNISLQEILQGIVELLPPAWLYPEDASARIILDGESYSNARFYKSGQKQVANIVVSGEERGIIEVAYLEEKPELDEGPFLREERNLIDTIAREIALIIERKQTEEDKARLQDQLRHADRLATIGQLSAGVAHELNEPIGSILGFAQLIEKYPKLSKQVKKDIEKIMKASLHAREVIKKLMLFARQMPPQKTKVNLNQIVKDGLYFLESRCAKEGITVERLLAKDLPEINADPSQMNQVLVNIIVNAIHSMQNGGKLTIQTKSSSKIVSLILNDTGIGMEEKIKNQIFLPFFTTKDVGEGTGLGLAVVHGIVTAHGGSIKVDSKVGKGTKFEIRLPVIPHIDEEKPKK